MWFTCVHFALNVKLAYLIAINLQHTLSICYHFCSSIQFTREDCLFTDLKDIIDLHSKSYRHSPASLKT